MDSDRTDPSPNPFLIGIFFVAILVIIVSSIQTWYVEYTAAHQKKSPFYQVTNRDFTLFLRENPNFLNKNISSKEAFLPGVEFIKQVSSNVETADDLINAPDDILFEYWTWNRLIDYPPPKRAIPLDEFQQFLKDYPEWTPIYWRSSPRSYDELYHDILAGKAPKELSGKLPDDVREAFIGWKNFTVEKEEIEKFDPTFGELKNFLATYPNFRRNYWINIVAASDPNYLETYSFANYTLDDKVPLDQIAPFLQIALFNDAKATQTHP